MSLPWFRVYHEIIDDDRILRLAFEDRWHFTALMACKAKGILDRGDSDEELRAAIKAKLGVDTRTLDEIERRLVKVGLIEGGTFQPVAWDKRQFRSDSSTDRVKAHREKVKRSSNGLDTDTDDGSTNVDPSRRVAGKKVRQKHEYTPEFEEAWALYPSRPGANKLEAFSAWNARIHHKDPVQRHPVDKLIAGVKRYAAYCRAMGTEPRFIKHPSTFFGPDLHFLVDWTPPPPREVGSGPVGGAREQRSNWFNRMTGNAAGTHDRTDEFIDVPARQVG